MTVSRSSGSNIRLSCKLQFLRYDSLFLITSAVVLPPAVESLRKGWEVTCQSASVIVRWYTSLCVSLLIVIDYQTSVFSVVSAIILVFLKGQDDHLMEASPRGHTLLLMAAYGAVVFNTSATIGSLALTDKLAEIPIAASQKPNLEKSGTTDSSPTELLKRFGAGSVWSYVLWHCESYIHHFVWKNVTIIFWS